MAPISKLLSKLKIVKTEAGDSADDPHQAGDASLQLSQAGSLNGGADGLGLLEDFGLFPFSDLNTTEPYHIDIIAIHGLGGHWKTTWLAEGEESIWLRDRLPTDLNCIKVKARIFSYGYDSATVFSNSITDIEAAAEMLLGRLRGVKKSEKEQQIPTIFICHSLGGLIVKKAIILAWNNNEHYGTVLESIRGCLFLGVPHRGADLAYWAQLPAHLIKYGSLNFTGNTRFLESLKRNSPEWMSISKSFVHRAKNLSIRSFYETNKLGNQMVVDKDSAIMQLPNEVALPLAGSNHRTICKFKKNDDQRYKPVADALEELVQKALSDSSNQPNNSELPVRNLELLISEMPLATSTFYGRETELLAITRALNSETPGQKGIVLYGIGGSGKTQLAIRYIKQYQHLYTAVIWINASSKEQAKESFNIAAEMIQLHWPADDLLPASENSDGIKIVLSQLRLTRNRYSRWLLVIDSIDDMSQNNPKRYIPSCEHGAVIVTSTLRQTGHVLGLPSLEIDRLDLDSGCQLLFECADLEATTVSEPDTNLAATIVKTLHGLPLAIEQAGAILQSSYSLSQFLDDYQTHYRLIMKDFPEGASYDKQRSILVVFDMLFNTIKEQNPDAAALLTFISIFGPWKVPITLMTQFNVKITEHNSSDEDTRALARALNDSVILRLALDKLNKACIVKLERNATRSCESFSLHRAIGDWCIKGLAQEKRGWIIQAALGLLTETLSSTESYYSPSWEIERRFILRRYLAPIDRCITLIQKTVPDEDLTAPDGKFCSDYAKIATKVAHVYLYHGRFQTAMRYFNSAIEFDRIDQGNEWPNTEQSLVLLGGLAVAYQKSGDLQNAAEVATTALELSERICDETDLRSTSLSSILKNINERREIMLQHHKSTVIAAADTKISPEVEHVALSQRSIPEGASFEEFDETANNYNYVEELRGACFAGDYGVAKLLLGLEEVEADAPDPGHRTPLSWAAENGHEAVVKLLLGTSKVNADSKDSHGQTPLSRAAGNGHEAVVKLLLLLGTSKVNADSKDRYDRTPLSWTAESGHEAVVKLLLVTGKVDVDSEDKYGRTPLSWAAGNGHEAVVKLLLATGKVEVDSKDRYYSLTPLSWAAGNGHEAVVKLLLATGKIEVDSKDRDHGWTPLSRAAGYGHEAMVKLLIATGKVEVDLKDRDGRTPLSYAAGNGHEAVAKLLRSNITLLPTRQPD